LVLIDIDGSTIYGWIGESDSTYWRLRPNDLLVWGIIELGKKLGYRVFDLVQYYSDNPKDEYYSLYVFKRSFGNTVWVQKYVEVFSQPKLVAWNVFRTIYKFVMKRVTLPF
jgi:lipid II:glycine glycyltransferase (peptidoglycan interpeptide bridge formation enzyme)